MRFDHSKVINISKSIPHFYFNGLLIQIKYPSGKKAVLRPFCIISVNNRKFGRKKKKGKKEKNE